MNGTPPVNPVLELVEAQTARALEVYRADPGMVEEHANNERRIEQGGYGDRQVFELVQNAADELRGEPGGEIAVVLTSTTLYCANQGDPVTAVGADTILRMSVSRKRGGQIGRFGVGVKSVLAICDAPQFFSVHDGERFAFGFDRAWSARRIRGVQPDAEQTPVLRTARALDVDEESNDDQVLRELLEWATTVVRLPLKDGAADRLARDLQSFPVEFPLFSPHVGTVTLSDRRVAEVDRQFFLRPDGVNHVLQEEKPDGTTVQHHWKVFHRTHTPTSVALASAGELHDRPSIDVSWAVPRTAAARGMFWSYFPTKFATLLRGLLNAPWKTSEDRQAIFDGNPFNEELLKVAADLVVDSLPELSTSDDPGGYLAFLPGRGREAPQFADERLTAAIWKAAGQRPTVADQDGVLRRATEVRLHPEGLDRRLLDMWAECEHRPSDWAHSSLETRERRPRIEQIYDSARENACTVVEWLEALVVSREPASSATAIRIVAQLVQSDGPASAEALEAAVVLTEAGSLKAPRPGTIFLRSGVATTNGDGLDYVDSRVLETFGISSALDVLRINQADPGGRLSAAADRGFKGYGEDDWRQFWELTREVGPTGAVELLRDRPGAMTQLRARVVAGSFRPLAEILRPGKVVPADGSRDAVIGLDLEFHAQDVGVLASLGLREGPTANEDPTEETWFEDYREAAWKSFMDRLPADARRPQLTTMRVEGRNPAGPLRLLARLTPQGTAAFVEELPSAGLVPSWSVQMGRQQSTRIPFQSPLAWMVRRHAWLNTTHGLRRTDDCVGPALKAHGDLLPVALIGEHVAGTLDLPTTADKVPAAVWSDAIASLAEAAQHDVPGRLYTLMIRSGVTWPEGTWTWCRVGDGWEERSDDEIAVTASEEDYGELVRLTVPALLVRSEEDAGLLIETWGMRRASELIKRELRIVPQADPEVVLDLFPALKSRERVEGWSVQRCAELERLVHSPLGISAVPLSRASADRTVLVLRPDDDLATLEAVDAELGLGLGPQQCRTLMENQEKRVRSQKVQEIRRTTSVPEKIVRLLGEDVLRERLPEGLESAEHRRRGRPLTPVEIGQLAIDAHGPGLLREYAEEVARRTDDAPRSYVGNESARRFVADLGLPASFAGASIPAPPVVETVPGPSAYPSLHGYQDTLATRMKDLILEPVPKRALLRLPTGAGKTRVAVEAVIRAVKTRALTGPVLWIAESNELCEQAVQSWKFVWGKVGPEEELTISRFWGGNDVVAVEESAHLVVATDATLHQRLDRPEMDWLRRPALVIVDEAHRATSRTYTGIFEKLGLSLLARRTDRPLIGLTATPFRGRNEAETHLLVERFGGRRLDLDLFGDEEPTSALQRLGVLARVDHRELAGATVVLSDEERAQADRLGTLPTTAEAQLGRDRGRNDTILREIVGLPADWSVLVFAVSVEHAKFLAASLNARGVGAASISGSTPPGQRRQVIEAYRQKNIRVLTNYGVLAQGFDAPATRAVVVARPAFSPNVYQQMIGRGLRGPANGGSEECLILDVGDNIENFEGQLAWSGFEYLWSGEGRT